MMRFVVVGLCVLCLSSIVCLTSAYAIDCDTLPPRFAFEMTPIDTFQFSGGNDCWGWVASDGTEYALFGGQTGIGFINVTAGTLADFETGPTCTWRDIKTYRHYAYEVSECGPGMRIWDLNYLPDSVHLVGTFTNGSTRSHNLSIDTAIGYAYLVRQNYSGFRVISLADPEAPAEGSAVFTGDLHDVFARNDTVWAAEGNDHTFSIWNMANKSAPVSIVSVSIPGNGYVHNIWPTRDGRYVATTEETPFRTVKIWNTTNFASITLVSEYLAPSQLAHNAHIEGDYLYISHYESGVAVVDISYPECPEEVALFDNYPPSESPNFNGCWGVYPHAQTGHVYASTIEGGLYVFSVNAITIDFTGSPTVGSAPLNVDFADESPVATGWKWYFGDGDSSTVQNPSHSYGPGLYAVQLKITTPNGEGSKLKPNFVTALAETLKVTDTAAAPGQSIVWDINHYNNVPLTEIKMPVQLSNIPSVATFDSISTVGCRTSYFELKEFLLTQYGSGRVVLRLKADDGGGSPALPPGDGPIARVYLTIQPGATAGQQVVLTMPPIGVAQHTLTAYTHTTSYNPTLISGTATVQNTCDCTCHGDPACDGVPTVLDLVETADVAFRNGTPTIDPNCPHAGRTDMDCSGSTTVVDVVRIVDVTFRNGDPQTLICDPCNP